MKQFDLRPFDKWLFTAKHANQLHCMHVAEYYHMKWIEYEKGLPGV